MRRNASPQMLQRLKDFATSHGMDSWARPLWRSLTGKKLGVYDQQVAWLVAHALPKDGICVDVGCHRGLVLDLCLKACPKGEFYAFEPIPYLYRLLSRKYSNLAQVHLSNVALSSSHGRTHFYVDTKALGRSGMHPRASGSTVEQMKKIEVTTDTLDAALPGVHPHFIKIDVEGAELRVLEGGLQLIRRSRPLIVFEHGLGGADYYGTKPEQMFDLLDSCGLNISLMHDYLQRAQPLSRQAFCEQYYKHLNYFFVAHADPR
jgi:FkbM family methyltransferase